MYHSLFVEKLRNIGVFYLIRITLSINLVQEVFWEFSFLKTNPVVSVLNSSKQYVTSPPWAVEERSRFDEPRQTDKIHQGASLAHST